MQSHFAKSERPFDGVGGASVEDAPEGPDDDIASLLLAAVESSPLHTDTIQIQAASDRVAALGGCVPLIPAGLSSGSRDALIAFLSSNDIEKKPRFHAAYQAMSQKLWDRADAAASKAATAGADSTPSEIIALIGPIVSEIIPEAWVTFAGAAVVAMSGSADGSGDGDAGNDSGLLESALAVFGDPAKAATFSRLRAAYTCKLIVDTWSGDGPMAPSRMDSQLINITSALSCQSALASFADVDLQQASTHSWQWAATWTLLLFNLRAQASATDDKIKTVCWKTVSALNRNACVYSIYHHHPLTSPLCYSVLSGLS